MNGTHKQIFIVITQTGTMLSRILKRITGAEYNHASLSLFQDLTRMYSFGRRHPYNPFWGGFVIESPHAGTFRRFSDTTAIILAVEITEERYAALEATLEAMWARREQFSYNLGGLLLAYFRILWKRSNCYYCSEFVEDTHAGISPAPFHSYIAVIPNTYAFLLPNYLNSNLYFYHTTC